MSWKDTVHGAEFKKSKKNCVLGLRLFQPVSTQLVRNEWLVSDCRLLDSYRNMEIVLKSSLKVDYSQAFNFLRDSRES